MAKAEVLDPSQMMEDLRGYVLDEERESYNKFLSSTLSISSDLAKRLLYQFVSENQGKVRATYALSGWEKPVASEGEPRKGSRKFVIVKDELLAEAKNSMSEVQSAHVFSIQKAPSTPPSSSTLWAAQHLENEEMYTAAPEVPNSLRDNRYAHIRCTKVVRDLKPRQLFPHSPGGAAAAGQPQSAQPTSAKGKSNPFSTPTSTKSEAPKSEAPKSDAPTSADSGKAAPKLSAAEMRMKELASGGASKPAEKPMCASMQRLMDLNKQGKAGSQQKLFGSGSSSKNKKSAFEKPEVKKKEEEEDDDDEPKKVEAKPILGFQFEFEKPSSDNPKAKATKKEKGGSEVAKKMADKEFINDDSEESAPEEEEDEDEKESGGKKKIRKRRRVVCDSEDEEPVPSPNKAKSKNQYKLALAEDSDEEEPVDKTGKKEEEEGSGDESDSSHSSQHTNASDPGARSPSRAVEAHEDAAKDDEDMPDGKLVITKKGSSKKVVVDDDEEVDGGKKKKSRSRKKDKDGEEGEAKPKRKKRDTADDADEGDAAKKKISRKKVQELDMNQKTLDVSAFKAAPETKPTGSSKPKKKVERTRMDEKGYLVTEEVWVEISDAEEAEVQDTKASVEGAVGKSEKPKAPAPPPAKAKPSAKPVVIKKQQAGIASFFTKK
eukprot:CAMPEP_0181299724 /NCGR_PEP_ID=MMETSP1101-20121128/6502_1 /TAXON_ID=46948 /ORGANISM="Rhodomonas abbreviata, Strain Caron Lab Isolate" /LENGTH=658 /DNA_ID=CAMNT_0023404899 /DNA_START=11 /DNA_END=1988 /DNA_ORIENTATION=-